MRYITKLNVLLLAVFFAVAYLLIQNFAFDYLCSKGDIYYANCGTFFFHAKFVALYFSFLLAPVVLTLPFKSAVFEAWRSFAVWAVSILAACSLFVIFADTRGGLNGALGQQLLSVVLLGLFGIYAFVSFIIMVIAAVKRRA